METKLVEAVKQAKEAVEDLEEPYKMEAFKIILEKLTSGDAGEKKISKKSLRKKNRTNGKQSSPKQSSPKGPQRKSEIVLSVEQLQKLKEYYSRFQIKGGEVCVFIIGNFIREIIKNEKFDGPEIETCYRSLISMKIGVPVIKDFDQVMSWLVSPSRKKEWFEKDSEGFSVSNTGHIVFNDLEKKLINKH